MAFNYAKLLKLVVLLGVVVSTSTPGYNTHISFSSHGTCADTSPADKKRVWTVP